MASTHPSQINAEPKNKFRLEKPPSLNKRNNDVISNEEGHITHMKNKAPTIDFYDRNNEQHNAEY